MNGRNCFRVFALALLLVAPRCAVAQEKTAAAFASDCMLCLAWSPDGKWVIGGAMDGTVRIWNGETGAKERDLEQPRRGVRGIAFSPSGGLVAVGGDDMQVRVWDTKTWTLAATLGGHLGTSLTSLAFSPDGSTLAVGSLEIKEQGRRTDTEIKLWDPAKSVVRRIIRLPGQHGSCVVFSGDSRKLYVAAGAVLVLDTESGENLRTLKLDLGKAMRLALAPDGKTLYAGGGYFRQLDQGSQLISEVYAWDLESGKLLHTTKDMQPWLRALALSTNGKLLATGSAGPIRRQAGNEWVSSEVRLWEAMTQKLLFTFEGKLGGMDAVAFAPGGKSLVCADSRHVYLVDVASGKEQALLHTVSMRRLP